MLALMCALMMLFMLGSMQRQSAGDRDQRRLALIDASELDGLTEDDGVRPLRAEMTRINWRQDSLHQDIERLERERLPEKSAASAPSTTPICGHASDYPIRASARST
jgi:hypothetical protein